jgi:hypothetical protein
MRSVTMLDPTAQPRELAASAATRLRTLEGRVVAILNNRWKAMDLVAERFEVLLRREHRVAGVLQRVIPLSAAAPGTLLDEVASRADVAVIGLAN